MRLAPEGKIIWGPAVGFWILCLFFAMLLRSSASIWLGAVGLLPAALTAYFFRDPRRTAPQMPGVVVAPADGKIIAIREVAGNDNNDDRRKISIFMSPLNVHVNRIPISGTVEKLLYSPGEFLAAFQDKSSDLNERQFIRIRSRWGIVDCVQIAGWLARRIVCNLEEGQEVTTGERFGLIRFGSRLDVYLPSECEVKATLGQRVRAGETVIGAFHEKY